MPDLSFGLIGLAILPIFLFFISTRLDDSLRMFRIGFNGLAFIIIMLFCYYATTFTTHPEPLWALLLAFIAIFIMYIVLEIYGLTFGLVGKAMERRFR
jgi:hypothetical protein